MILNDRKPAKENIFGNNFQTKTDANFKCVQLKKTQQMEKKIEPWMIKKKCVVFDMGKCIITIIKNQNYTVKYCIP